jgi:Flp pilus assembly protein TadG
MKIWPRCCSLFVDLGSDQNGGVLLYFTIMIPVIIGMIGLALEGGQYFHLNSELQQLADAAALAGAAELDGTSDAITRATSKAETLLSNDPHWSNVAQAGLQIVDPPVFYSSLDPDVTTTDGTQAVYIQVTTIVRQVAPAFLSVIGFGSTAGTHARAVAGTNYVACNVQPLMLCNPKEPSAFTATAGDLFGFTATGSTGGFSPGDFGLLDPGGQTHSGAGQIENLLAAKSPNFCYVDRVSPAQGQKTIDVASGINVRFDIPPQGNPKGMDLTPAPNVIKGQSATVSKNSCTFADTSPYAPMPGNTGMTQVGSTYVGGSMDTSNNPGGAGTYWTNHHGAGSWPTGMTRYGMYQAERAGTYPLISSFENPAPVCNGTAGDDTRRIISVAIVDCQAQGVNGNSNVSLLSKLYADFFLTAPVLSSSSKDLDCTGNPAGGVICAEFIRFVTPVSDNTKLHQIVQLYR